MRMPDFFIVGAGKCGTTALATWLGAHPKIFIPTVKEPHYWTFDHPRHRSVESALVYEKLFKRAKRGQKCGEASTSYIWSKQAVPMILAHNSRAKFIAMVRNPIDMAVSLHAQKIYSQIETEHDFSKAWHLSPERPQWLDYQNACMLGTQIARLQALVSPEQLKIIVKDDLDSDPAAVYRDVLDFLEVTHDGRTDFSVINARKALKSEELQSFMRNPPWPLSWIKQALKKAAPIYTKTLRQRYNALNTRPAEKTQLSPELRSEIVEFFRPDVARLSACLNRDLSHWST